ncbi:hypothetical protein [Mycolicibacterium sphagni]|uniref:hypothetical protein n=1 Tax=Mycolicibacterium sphagni TaxID=1786 RepID=UPI0021F29003|nr:hypothetical protein [Mycolicibacterium sphagni]MCV7174937.1 hypothetical protein [Mycolicibacterium sphagni]
MVLRMKVASANISFDHDALQALLKGPVANGMLYNGLDRLRDEANSSAITVGADYGSAVFHPDDESAAVGYVYTKNYKARVDDHYHSTLLKVMASAPSIIAAGEQFGNGDEPPSEPATPADSEPAAGEHETEHAEPEQEAAPQRSAGGRVWNAVTQSATAQRAGRAAGDAAGRLLGRIFGFKR